MQVSHGELIILHWEELERANYGRMSLDSRRGREGRLFFFSSAVCLSDINCCHCYQPLASTRAQETVDDDDEGDGTLGNKRLMTEWGRHSKELRVALQLPFSAKPWTGRKDVTLHGVRRIPRDLDCIDICWAHMRKKLGPDIVPEDVRKDLFVNATQSVKRLPVTKGVPLLCQRTTPYSYEYDTVLSGRDCLSLQGFPTAPSVAPPHKFEDHDIRALAGESHFLPVMGSLVYAYWLNPLAPWWKHL